MTSREEAVRALAQLLGGLSPARYRARGLLGAPGGTTVEVSGRTSTVFFREDGSDNKVVQVFNNRVPSYYDLPVIVGRDDVNPETLQVLDIDIEALADWRGRSYLTEHHQTHEYGATDDYGVRIDNDVVYVQGRQIVPLSIRPTATASMKVFINAGWYEFGEDRYFFPGMYTRTLVAPATPGVYALEVVYIEAVTNYIGYARGIEVPLSELSDYVDYVPSVPPHSALVGCVLLASSTTAITQREIVDIRSFNTIPGGVTNFDNGISVTGDVLVTGGQVAFYDSYVDLQTGSRLRMPRGTPITGWEGQEGEAAYDTAFDSLFVHDGSQWNELASRAKSTTRITASDSPYTTTPTLDVLLCDTDGGAITGKLQAGSDGRHLRIVNCGDSGNDVTIVSDAAEAVRGDTRQTLADGEILILVFEPTEAWW